MTVAAELRAIYLITTFPGRREPNRDARSRNGVLSHSHCDDLEGMNHIFGTYIPDDRLIDGHMQLALNDKVVFSRGISRINTERILCRHQTHLLLAKHAIFAGVTPIPLELLPDNINFRCGLFVREF